MARPIDGPRHVPARRLGFQCAGLLLAAVGALGACTASTTPTVTTTSTPPVIVDDADLAGDDMSEAVRTVFSFSELVTPEARGARIATEDPTFLAHVDAVSALLEDPPEGFASLEVSTVPGSTVFSSETEAEQGADFGGVAQFTVELVSTDGVWQVTEASYCTITDEFLDFVPNAPTCAAMGIP